MKLRVAIAIAALATFACTSTVYGQRIAILVPEANPLGIEYSRKLSDALESELRVIDADLAAAAYASIKVESPFNQTFESAKSIGTLIGCDHLIFLKTQTDRRSSSVRASYFESSAFIFLVNARTGRLEQFIRASQQSDTSKDAESLLINDAVNIAKAVGSKSKAPAAEHSPEFEMFDAEKKTMRPAMPYRRIKPEYSSVAFLFDVKATVDAEVSIDENGVVKKIDILRWAGFGLDDAVIDAVNKMNWRPGERNGKPFPMRVLLRYNFTKVDKEP